MVELDRLAVFGKPSGQEDFQVVWCPGEQPPEETVGIAAQWLQSHMNAPRGVAVGVVRAGGALWLMRPDDAAAADDSGRPSSRIVFGRLPPDMTPADVCRAMLGAYASWRPGPTPQSAAIELRDAPAHHGRVAQATLALATRSQERVLVDSPGTAAGVLALLGWEPLNYVAITGSSDVASLPKGVAILVVLDGSAPFINQPDAGDVRLEHLQEVDLAGLRALPLSPAQRFEVLHALCRAQPLPPALPGTVLSYVLSHPSGRERAIAAADADTLVGWLQAGLLDADLTRMAVRPPPGASAEVARRLKPGAGSLRRFVEWFGPGVDGIERLLPNDLVDLRRWMATPLGQAPIAGEELSTALALLQEVGLSEPLGIELLARLVRETREPCLIARYCDALVEHGLAQPVSEALLTDQPLADLPSSIGLPAPEGNWLAGVPLERLHVLGDKVYRDAGWRRWWAAALHVHLDAHADEAPDCLDLPWSRWRGLWLVGALQDGDVSPDDALRAIAAWHGAGSLDLAALTGLVEAASIRLDDGSHALLAGRGTSEWTDVDTVAAERLLRASVIDPAGFATWVADHAPLRALSAVGLSPDARALLGLEPLPPLGPPHEWPAACTPVLCREAARDAFWHRWSPGGGVPPSLLDWLAEQLNGRGAQLVEACQAATRRRLRLAELTSVAPALTAEAVCHQIGLWALERSSPDAQNALACLLDNDGPLHFELRRWLRLRLLEWSPPSPVPALSDAEMLALFPLLDPVNDIVRVAIRGPSRGPSEPALLDNLIDHLQRSPARAAPPAPPPELLRLRPEWAERLGQLEGWGHWLAALRNEVQHADRS